MNQPYSAPSATDDVAAVRWGNLAVWTIVSLLATAIGVFLVPLTVPNFLASGKGALLVPIAPVLVIATNLVLPRVMYTGTGWGWSVFIPPAVWMVVAFSGASVSSGGDLLIPGNSFSSVVGLAYLGLGAMSAMMGIAIARMKPKSQRRKPEGIAA